MKSSGHDGPWKVVMRKAGEHGQTTPSRGLYGYTKSRVMRPPSEESGKRNTVTQLSKKSEVLMSSQSHTQGITTSWGDRGTFGRCGSRRFTGTTDVEHQPEVFHHGSTFDYSAARQKEVIFES